MSHTCSFTRREYLMLSLPERDGRYELFQQHLCQCGNGWSCTSYAYNTGRHPSLHELRDIKGKEETHLHKQGIYTIEKLSMATVTAGKERQYE